MYSMSLFPPLNMNLIHQNFQDCCQGEGLPRTCRNVDLTGDYRELYSLHVSYVTVPPPKYALNSIKVGRTVAEENDNQE